MLLDTFIENWNSYWGCFELTGDETIYKKTNINQRIIQHLMEKKGHKDNIEGITLMIYEKEIKHLSDQIMDAIFDLLSRGLIVESSSSSGQKYYQLSDSHSVKSEIIE
jgi:hypothetical protein